MNYANVARGLMSLIFAFDLPRNFSNLNKKENRPIMPRSLKEKDYCS